MPRTEDHSPSWQELFAVWRGWRFPPRPPEVGDVNLVMLDADTAGLLLRLSRSGGVGDALTLHLLQESQGRLTGVVGRSSGECREYFEALEDIVSRVFEQGRGGPL